MKFRLPLLLALLSTAITSKGQATYEMSFIGSFAGTSISGVISTPTGINSSGDVVGWAYTASGVRQGFVYSNGSVTNVGNSLNPSSPHTYASINDSGTLAGSSSLDAIFRNGTTVTSLATLGGTNGGSATGINNAGQIVGYSWTSGNAAQHAFLYSGGSMTDLGSLGTGANGSYAWAINNSGTVVGESYVTGSRTHAFSYSGGILTDLTPGYSNSTGAYSVNDLGLAVGFAYTVSGITAVRFESNTFTSLGSLGGSVGTAYDVNSVGDIVGWSRTTAGENHAFLYTSGSMVDLNTMTNLPSGWILTNAVGINDAGSIAASATYGGLSYAVVLTAIPEPSTYVALVGGLALLSAVAIKRRNLRMAR